MNTQESIIKIFLHINNIEHVYFNKLQFDMKIMRIGKKSIKIFQVQVYEIFVKGIMLYNFPEKISHLTNY